MPQYEDIKNDELRLIIKVSVRCKDHPRGRIWRSGVYPGVKKGSKKASTLEKRLIIEAEQEKAIIKEYGSFWVILLELYENYAQAEFNECRWTQSRQTLDEALVSLRKHTGAWNDKLTAKITSADVTRLLHQLKKQGMADSTISKMRGNIKKVFDFGIIFEHVKGLHQSPTIGVSISSRKRKKQEILQADEIKKLLVCAKEYEPKWYYVWAFAVYTGARANELYAMKWSDIDFKQELIIIQRGYSRRYKTYQDWTKNGGWRNVSICSPLMEIIRELQAKNAMDEKRGIINKHSEYLLPRPGEFQNWSQAKKIRAFCTEIGITPVGFHTLRACFATELLKRGVPIPRVMRVGGWKSLKTMMHYVRLAGIDDKGTTDALDFRTDIPNQKAEDRVLMKAVGEKFDASNLGLADVLDLASFQKVK